MLLPPCKRSFQMAHDQACLCPYSGRNLSVATTAILQETPAYEPYVNDIYGTGQDPFALSSGGYYVSAGQANEPTSLNTYGEH